MSNVKKQMKHAKRLGRAWAEHKAVLARALHPEALDGPWPGTWQDFRGAFGREDQQDMNAVRLAVAANDAAAERWQELRGTVLPVGPAAAASNVSAEPAGAAPTSAAPAVPVPAVAAQHYVGGATTEELARIWRKGHKHDHDYDGQKKRRGDLDSRAGDCFLDCVASQQKGSAALRVSRFVASASMQKVSWASSPMPFSRMSSAVVT